METNPPERFQKAKEYFYKNCEIKLREDQKEHFLIVEQILLDVQGNGKPISFSDVTGLGLPRRGGNTECLAHLVAIGMASLGVTFHIHVANKTTKQTFFKLVMNCLQIFECAEVCGIQLSIYKPFENIIVKQNLSNRSATLEVLLMKDEIKRSPLEKQFDFIETSLSSELRDIARALLGFIHSGRGEMPYVMKEYQSQLLISLGDSLVLVVVQNGSGKYTVCFKSFITQSFDYPAQISEIVCALDVFFSHQKKKVPEPKPDNWEIALEMSKVHQVYRALLSKAI